MQCDPVAYTGVDLSLPMVEHARDAYVGNQSFRFQQGAVGLNANDYCIASGIFNLKFQYDDASWRDYVVGTIEELNTFSLRGFAFNMLTIYSDADRMRADLYYPDPAFYFDLCKRRFSRNVALLHDYELYEFTIIVRKS